MRTIIAFLFFAAFLSGQSFDGIEWTDVASVDSIAKADIAGLDGMAAPDGAPEDNTIVLAATQVNTDSTGLSHTFTLTVAVDVGDVLVIIGNFSAGIESVSDDSSNTWTSRSTYSGGTGLQIRKYSAEITTPLGIGDEVTMNFFSPGAGRKLGGLVKIPNAGALNLTSAGSNGFAITGTDTGTLTATSGLVGCVTYVNAGTITGGAGVGDLLGSLITGSDRYVQLFKADSVSAGSVTAGITFSANNTTTRQWMAFEK